MVGLRVGEKLEPGNDSVFVDFVTRRVGTNIKYRTFTVHFPIPRPYSAFLCSYIYGLTLVPVIWVVLAFPSFTRNLSSPRFTLSSVGSLTLPELETASPS